MHRVHLKSGDVIHPWQLRGGRRRASVNPRIEWNPAVSAEGEELGHYNVGL